MQPARPSLADALRIIDGLWNPVCAKSDGGKPPNGHRPGWWTRSSFELVEQWSVLRERRRRFWRDISRGDSDRLASAAHSWAPELVDKNDFATFRFSYGTLVLAESEISDGKFLVVMPPLMIPGYPFSRKVLCKERLGMASIRNWYPFRKCGTFEVKRRFAREKLQFALTLESPYLKQVQSVAGSARRISQMFPSLRPFLSRLYGFSKTKVLFKKLPKKCRVWTPRQGNFEIYTGARASPPFEKESTRWESGIGIGGSRNKRGVMGFPPIGDQWGIPPLVERDKSPKYVNRFLWTSRYLHRGILWKPERLCNNGRLWLEIPIAPANLGGISFSKNATRSVGPHLGCCKKRLPII